MKRFIMRHVTLLLAIITVLTASPFGISAEPSNAEASTEYTYGDLIYTIENGEITITDYSLEESDEISIPAMIDGYPVTGIADFAFMSCPATSIFIPNSVEKIGMGAFYNCFDLTSVTLSGSITSIELGTFLNCLSLTSINIPDSVTSIGDAAFGNCGSLTSVTIPKSVTSIGFVAFGGCDSMTVISVDAANPNYCSADGILFSKDKTALVVYPSGRTGSYTVPDSVTHIVGTAFYTSGLTNIYIPVTVIDIGEGAFGGSESLTDISVAADNPNYCSDGGVLFSKDKSVLIAFPSGRAGSYTVPGSVTEIIDYAFDACNELTKVTISKNVTYIGSIAFSECESLTDISVAADNPNYCSDGGVLFSKDKKILITFPAGRAGSYTVPDSVKSIGDCAFQYCTGLTAVIIPKSVTSIGEYVFDGCFWLIINCYEGSEAHLYAEENDLLYVILTDTSLEFDDVKEGEWYKPYIDYAVTYGLLSGTGNRKMAPNRNITRAEFVQVLANLSGVDTSDKNVNAGFVDVKRGDWYAPAVKWASENGIVYGMPGGGFAPNTEITREQMCTILIRYVENYLGFSLDTVNEKKIFADDAKISSWAKDAVYKCQMGGLVSGVSATEFAPASSANRASVATIMTRFHEQYLLF